MGTGSVTDWFSREFFGLPTVPVPFFGRRIPSTVEKRDRHLAATVFPTLPADIRSEPVPIFH